MFEGRVKRQDLINELRSTHALQEAGLQMMAVEKQATLTLQKQHEEYVHKVSVAVSVLE